MLMEGGLPNYFTSNGKAYPSMDVIHMKVGQTVKLRFIGTSNNFIHQLNIWCGGFSPLHGLPAMLRSALRFAHAHRRVSYWQGTMVRGR
jgi:hypothetical protein